MPRKQGVTRKKSNNGGHFGGKTSENNRGLRVFTFQRISKNLLRGRISRFRRVCVTLGFTLGKGPLLDANFDRARLFLEVPSSSPRPLRRKEILKRRVSVEHGHARTLHYPAYSPSSLNANTERINP
jgi:hypothetical protein